MCASNKHHFHWPAACQLASPCPAIGGMGKWPWLTSQWRSLQVPKLQEELEGLQKQADSLGAASEAALQEYQSLKQAS